MSIYKSLCLLSAFIVALTSCTKEESGEPYSTSAKPKLLGGWDFIEMAAYTKSTSSATMGGEENTNVVITDYATVRNKGILLISADRMTSYDMTYSIDTVMLAQRYNGGKLVDEFKLPFKFTFPVTNNSGNYWRVGADSIYFSQGLVTMPDNGGISTPGVTSGATIAWSGDTLLLRSSYYDKQMVNEGGITMINETQAIMVLKYKRR